MVVLGVDPGIYSCGLALLELRPDWTWRLLDGFAAHAWESSTGGKRAKVQTVRTLSGDVERFAEQERALAWTLAVQWLRECPHVQSVEVCIVEDAVKLGGQNAHGNTRCGAYIQGFMASMDVESVVLHPNSWTSKLGSHRGTAGIAALGASALAGSLLPGTPAAAALGRVQHFCDAVAIGVLGAEATCDIPVR